MEPDPEFEAKIRILTDIILSLGRTSSEHDERLDRANERLSRAEEILANLAQTSQDHAQALQDHAQTVQRQNQMIDRILGILAAVAEADEQIRREFQERNARVDEEIAILVRMMDEWIRRQPPNGKDA